MTTRKTAAKKIASKKPVSKAPSKAALKPGDVVRLKSDRNQVMTIESVGKDAATCTWSPGSNGYLETRPIALAALVRVEGK